MTDYHDLCRKLWGHEEVRKAWGEWRDGDGYLFLPTKFVHRVGGKHAKSVEEMALYPQSTFPIFPLSDSITPGRGLLGMILETEEISGIEYIPQSNGLVLLHVTFYRTVLPHRQDFFAATLETAAATLLLEILEGKDEDKVTVGPHKWEDEHGKHSAAFYPFINGRACPALAHCHFCRFYAGEDTKCRKAQEVGEDDKLYSFCGPVCGYFNVTGGRQ